MQFHLFFLRASKKQWENKDWVNRITQAVFKADHWCESGGVTRWPWPGAFQHGFLRFFVLSYLRNLTAIVFFLRACRILVERAGLDMTAAKSYWTIDSLWMFCIAPAEENLHEMSGPVWTATLASYYETRTKTRSSLETGGATAETKPSFPWEKHKHVDVRHWKCSFLGSFFFLFFIFTADSLTLLAPLLSVQPLVEWNVLSRGELKKNKKTKTCPTFAQQVL